MMERRVLTEADSLADLLGEPRPPRPGDEDYIPPMPPPTTTQCKHYMPLSHGCDDCTIERLVSERDALAVRVRELEAALRVADEFMTDVVRDVLGEAGYSGEQLAHMVAKARQITKPDSPHGKVIAALTTPESKP